MYSLFKMFTCSKIQEDFMETTSQYANFNIERLILETHEIIEKNHLSRINGLGIQPIQKNLEDLVKRIQQISTNRFADATGDDLNRILAVNDSLNGLKVISKNFETTPAVSQVMNLYEVILGMLNSDAKEIDQAIQKGSTNNPQQIGNTNAHNAKAENFFSTMLQNIQTTQSNSNEITPYENVPSQPENRSALKGKDELSAPKQTVQQVSASKAKEKTPTSQSKVNPSIGRYAPSVIHDQDKLNRLSTEMDRIEAELKKRSNQFLARIAGIDVVMRETLALRTDIVSAKLEIVEFLLNSPSEQVDFSSIPKLFLEKLEKIVNDHIGDYTSLIKAREQVMVEGKPVLIDEKKKEELIAAEKKRVEEEIAKIMMWSLSLDTDLNAERENLQKQFNDLLDFFQTMMKSKTWMTDEHLKLIDTRKRPPEYKAFEKEKETILHGAPSTDIWMASEVGDVTYLETHLKSFLEKQNAGDKIKAFVSFNPPEYTFCNRKSSQGYYPLHLACSHGKLKVVEFLMNHLADPKLLDDEGRSPLHWAAKSGVVEVAEILLSKGKLKKDIRCTFDRTPLHYATYNGHVEMTRFLCDQKSDVNALATKDNNKTPLHDAVMQNREDVVKYLVTLPQLNIDSVDDLRLTPLCHAVQGGFVKIAKMLIGRGAECAVLTERGKTLFQQAVLLDDQQMALLLIGQKPGVNAQPTQNGKKTALHEATLKGLVKMVQLLVDRKELDVNLTDNKGFSPLYYAVSNGELEIATFIVGHKSWKWPTNPSDPNHWKHLLTLVPKKQKDEIKKLLESLPKD